MSDEIKNCKDCNKQLERDKDWEYYSINIGDEIARSHNQSEKFKLCPSCWGQKKESFKQHARKGWNIKSNIVVWKVWRSGMSDFLNCRTCQKWSDEYEPVRHGSYEVYDYCSAECERNKDKPNNREREREREREQNWVIKNWNKEIRENNQ